ncbi:MAG TPA: hypothetical protein PK992_18545 [Planctomycetaceae bacterium]|nr:hypothetical protein [Planctomycetaceae bacterium]
MSVTFAVNGGVSQAQWYGGYYHGWGGGVGTAYSADVRARASMTMAQGAASEYYARARVTNEAARSQYIDNQAKYIAMRRQLRAANEADEEKRKEEARARAALRPPPKSLAQIYPGLSADQLDPLTGEIHWLELLEGNEYSDDRKVIEEALRAQAEYGASDRTSKIIFEAAHRMMKTLSGDYAKVGAENYSSYRRFLNSLSVEGQQAQEGLK